MSHTGRVRIFLIAFLFLIFIAGVHLFTGSAKLSPAEVLGAICGAPDVPSSHREIVRLRFLRTALAMVAGASLATAGVVYQCVLVNPLADPFILGCSSGAAFGASLAMALGAGAMTGLPLYAFTGSLIAVMLVWWLAGSSSSRNEEKLLLAGVAVNAFLSSLLTLVIYASRNLTGVFFWMMGSLAVCDTRLLLLATFLFTGVFFVLFGASRILDVLYLGPRASEGLGIKPRRTHFFLLVSASLIVASTVALTGIIGFVGLIVPHIARILGGGIHRVLLPLSALLGAGLLVLCDIISVHSPWGELPVGIVTSLVGAPFFLKLLFRKEIVRE